MSENYYPPGPAVLYVTADDPAEVHILDSPLWSPGRLNYVERATLAARLRAVADAVDPGEFVRQLGVDAVPHMAPPMEWECCASGSCEVCKQ